MPDFHNLPNLVTFEGYYNRLGGSVPDFSNLPNLKIVNLSFNQLEGSIPDLSALTQLQYLYLHDNHLQGTIPDFSNLTGLLALTLSENRLSGTIPDFSHLEELQKLTLGNNQLQGVIPNELCSLPITTADFDYNKLNVIQTDDCILSLDEYWQNTQTVPPTNVLAMSLMMDKLVLQWDIISYTDDGGYYEVLMSVTSGGPYDSAGKTASKYDDSLTVDGLTPGQTYYFIVRTFTPAHDYQQNDLTSENSDEVLVMLTAITTDGTDVTLAWTPATQFVQYDILYSTDFYFQPEDAGVTVATTTSGSWTHAGAAADAANNYAYLLRGVDSNGDKSPVFNRTGEFTFSLTPGG